MAEIVPPLEVWTPESSGCSFQHVYDFQPNHAGQVWIADYRSHRLCELGGDGKLLKMLEGIQSPHGLSIDGDDFIYITNYRGNTLQKMTPSGQSLFVIGREGNGPGEFVGAVSSAVNSKGEIYVADYHNHRIQKFDPAGKFMETWGSLGSGPGQFNLPHALSLDKEDRVYVADRKNSRIQVFAGNGDLLKIMLDDGSEPLGLAIDDSFNVYVADMARHQVVVFSPSGQIVLRLGGQGGLPGQFDIPTNVRLDSKGRLFVSEQGNFRVQIFLLTEILSRTAK